MEKVYILFIVILFASCGFEKPKQMEIKTPPKQEVQNNNTNTGLPGTLYLGIKNEDTIFYRHGDEREYNKVEHSMDSLVWEHRRNFGDSSMVLIISGQKSKYKTVVDILDLLNKHNIKRFAIVEPDEEFIKLDK